MSSTKFYSKFKDELAKLNDAVEGNVSLDIEYPKLYQKLTRFYEDRGLQLYQDPEDDYNVILDQVANGVAMRMAILTKYLSQ